MALIPERGVTPSANAESDTDRFLAIIAPLPLALPEAPTRLLRDSYALDATIRRNLQISSKSITDLQLTVIAAWTLLIGRYLATNEFEIRLSDTTNFDINACSTIPIDLEEIKCAADLKSFLGEHHARASEEPSLCPDSLQTSRLSLLTFADGFTENASESVFPLVLRCAPAADEIILNLSYDNSYLREQELDRLISALEKVLRQTSSTPGSIIAQVDFLTAADLNQITLWNDDEPEVVHRCIHNVLSDCTIPMLLQFTHGTGPCRTLSWSGSPEISHIH